MASGGKRRRGPIKAVKKETPLTMALGIVRYGAIIIGRKIAAFFRALGAILSRLVGRLSKNAAVPFAIGGAVIILALVIGLSIRGATKKNANEITFNDKTIGAVMFDKNGKKGEEYGKYIFDLAVSRLTAQTGAEVRVKESVTAKEVHAKKNSCVPESTIVTILENSFTYDVAAVKIYVDAQLIATLSSEETANGILDDIKKSAFSADLNIVRAEFIENVEVRRDFVSPGEITDATSAKQLLTANKQEGQTYKVVDGDNLTRIAANAGMTVEELLAVNPGISITTVLHIGDTLNILLAKPLVSVRTFERRTYTEVIEKPVETVYNDNYKKSYKEVVTQGRDGERTVTADIIRENKFEVGRNIVEETVTTEPIKEVVEVGTR